MLKQKYSIILFFVIFFIFILSSITFGFTYSVDGKDVKFTNVFDDKLNENQSNYFVMRNFDSSNNLTGYFMYIYTGSNNFRYDVTNNRVYFSGICYKLETKADGSEWGGSPYSKENGFFSAILNQDTLIYTGSNILDYSTGEVVFRPVLTLGQALEKANPVKTYQTTMSGMILSLVVFLVLLVGFLKAWSILSNSLRKA